MSADDGRTLLKAKEGRRISLAERDAIAGAYGLTGDDAVIGIDRAVTYATEIAAAIADRDGHHLLMIS
jgi:hypothetical protein